MDSRCLLSYVVSISILFLFTQLFLWVLMGIFTQGWCPGYPFLHPTFLLVFNGCFHPRVVPGLSFCSSNFIMSFNRRLHPLSIFRLSSVAILIVRFFQIFFVFFLDSLHVLIIKIFLQFCLMQSLSLKIYLLFICERIRIASCSN